MVVLALALDALLRTCAPNIGARTMTAIVRVESGGDPLAIHDNTLDRAFAPRDVDEAVAWSKQLIALNHSVDLGISQLNNANLPRLGLSIREAFDPCANLRGGATVLGADYRDAATHFGPGQFALRRAIGAYNTGSLFSGASYVAKILAAAGIAAEDDFRVPDIAALDGSVPWTPERSAVAPSPRAPARRPRAVARRVVPAPPDPAVAAMPAPILIQVTHIDTAARERAIAAAANGTPAVRTTAGPLPEPGAPGGPPVVLHLNGQPAPPPASLVP